jgi:hypothetical protein
MARGEKEEGGMAPTCKCLAGPWGKDTKLQPHGVQQHRRRLKIQKQWCFPDVIDACFYSTLFSNYAISRRMRCSIISQFAKIHDEN